MRNPAKTRKHNASNSEPTELQIWMIIIAMNIATWALIFMFDR